MLKAKLRLFIDQPLSADLALPIEGDDAHYILKVMRMTEGQHLALFNGRDGEWLAEIEQTSKKSLIVRVQNQSRPQEKVPDIWLLFAPIKKARLDFMAQKATELGVSGIWPVYTRRTVVTRLKDERLWANAKEAAEQCERLSVPEVFAPCTLKELLADWPEERSIIFCDEDMSGASIMAAAKQMTPQQQKGPWAILIGPEGGFDDEERALVRSKPYVVPVSLGPRVLRADTAAMAALALWQTALGDW